ncbi:hypothetical protein B5S29_g5050 [[Candida] boidinii]|nr:hypothetical protein B5S29_g5050 [[Candida] boidinii]
MLSTSIIRPSLNLVRSQIIVAHQSGKNIRFFSSSISAQLLYKSKPQLKKTAAEQLNNSNGDIESNKILSTKKIVTKSDIEDKDKETKLLKNKYYKRTPNFLKPYMRSLMLRPMGFGLSFVILHEVSAVIPFLGLWYLFMKIDWMPLEVPADLVNKGLEIISKGIQNLDTLNLAEKAKMATAGANAYALTKVLLPIRIPICFILAPYFDKFVIRPFGRLFGRNKKKVVRSQDGLQDKIVEKEIWETKLEAPKKKEL